MNKFDYGKHSKEISVILHKAFPGNAFTARDIVEYARPKKSPLHKFFEWDDDKAADQYRLTQARTLIKCIVIKLEGVEVREFQNVFVKAEDRRLYVQVDQARAAPELWQQVLESALAEATAWKRRYQHLSQLSPIIQSIEEVEIKHGKGKETSGSNREGRKDIYPHGDIQNGKANTSRRFAATR